MSRVYITSPRRIALLFRKHHQNSNALYNDPMTAASGVGGEIQSDMDRQFRHDIKMKTGLSMFEAEEVVAAYYQRLEENKERGKNPARLRYKREQSQARHLGLYEATYDMQLYPGLQVIIDILKKNGPDCYNQGIQDAPYEVNHTCETPCCIGGHAAIELKRRCLTEYGINPRIMDHPSYEPSRNLYLKTVIAKEEFQFIDNALSKLCDIPIDIAGDLCWGNASPSTPFEGTIRVLEHCRDTGKVNWKLAFPEEQCPDLEA